MWLLSLGLFLGSSLCLAALRSGTYFVLAPPPSPDRDGTVRLVELVYRTTQSHLASLQPLFWLLWAASLATIALLPPALFGWRQCHQQLKKSRVYATAGLFTALLAAWVWIGWTKIQLSPDYSIPGWYTLGAPILDSQLFLVFLTACVLLSVLVLAKRRWNKLASILALSRWFARKDAILAALIWICAALYWAGLPPTLNWFLSGPHMPNMEYYPNSDAYLYDSTAQSLLIGEGYQTGDLDYPLRPAYGLFVAGLHAVFGQDYEKISRAQAAILAVFPALVYLIAARLMGRTAGCLAALLVILREGNAIVLADRITVSNSRLIMAETPTAIGVALVIYLVILWTERIERRAVISLLLGALIALFMLFRIEIAVLLPLTLLIFGIRLYGDPKKWLLNAAMVILGLVLFLTPWVYRNYRVDGLVYIERPNERVSYFLARSGIVAVPGTAQGTPGAGTNQAYADLYRRVQTYYLNSQIQGMLIFPTTLRWVDSLAGWTMHQSLSRALETCCSRENYLARLPFWDWHSWEGEIPKETVFPITLNLFILCMGIVQAAGKKRALGIFPSLVAITHYLTSSAVRISGGRFVQIVDWIWILYFAAGLSQLIYWVLHLLWGSARTKQISSPFRTGTASSSGPFSAVPARFPMIWKAGVLIFLAAMVLTLAEWVIPARYSPASEKALVGRLRISIDEHPQPEIVVEAIENPGRYNLLRLQGRALYPRHHREMRGESGITVTPFTPRDFGRFSFFLVGPENAGVLLPWEAQPKVDFPHASDVLVYGCQGSDTIRGEIVYVKETGLILVSDTILEDLPCSQP